MHNQGKLLVLERAIFVGTRRSYDMGQPFHPRQKCWVWGGGEIGYQGST